MLSPHDLVVDLDDLDRLDHGRRRLDGEIGPEWLRKVMHETDAVIENPAQIALEVSLLTDATLLVRGRVDLAYAVPCARCLAPSHVDAGGELCVTYVPAARLGSLLAAAERDDEGIVLGEEDLDQLTYEGRRVDLAELLGEQALLAYPMRLLCSRGEACRGLCARCGEALNDHPAAARCPSCGHSGDEPESGADDATSDTPWKRALRGLVGEPGDEP